MESMQLCNSWYNKKLFFEAGFWLVPSSTETSAEKLEETVTESTFDELLKIDKLNIYY